MAGYSTRNVLRNEQAQTVGANQTNQAITKIFNMSSGVTVGTGITAKLQHAYKKTVAFQDISPAVQVSVTGDGNFELEFDVTEDNAKPLWPLGRIVITTGAGDSVTVDGVVITRVL